MNNKNIKAIVVGISDYSAYDNVPDLPYSGYDVLAIVHGLINGLHIDGMNIWGKTRNSGTMTKESFLEGVKLFLSDTTPADTVIFYFTGHGATIDGRHCLAFSNGYLETQSVIDLFEQMHVRKRLLLLDCCMSGNFQIEKWTDSLADEGTAVLASSQPYELAGYDKDITVSKFTLFLCVAMLNPNHIENGSLSLYWISCDVAYQAEQYNKTDPGIPQHPVLKSNLKEDIIFEVR